MIAPGRPVELLQQAAHDLATSVLQWPGQGRERRRPPPARWELPEELVEALRAGGILYDCEPAGGEFFQLYTFPAGDQLFFEVVRRTGGYQGYGSVNAATRMAAQR